MIEWLIHHGATVLIFLGGGFSAFSAFISERRASGVREARRKGFWPFLILVGAMVGGFGALWAGYGQDKLLDYLSGGDSYGFLVPLPPTNNSVPFLFVQHGESPLYDVVIEATDVTKWQQLSRERSLVPAVTPSEEHLTTDQWDRLWKSQQETKTTLTIGNVGPNENKLAWEAPIPKSDDEHYEFAIWARNGLFTEQVLMHQNSTGWTWAWRLERTPIEMKNGKPQKLDKQIMPDFPHDKLILN